MVKIEQATPARQPPLKKQSSSAASTKNQSSILGFFSKAASNGTHITPASGLKINGLSVSSNSNPKLPSASSKKSKAKAHNATPVASSDPVDPSSSQENAINNV